MKNKRARCLSMPQEDTTRRQSSTNQKESLTKSHVPWHLDFGRFIIYNCEK